MTRRATRGAEQRDILSPDERAAASRAGGWGLGIFSAGVNLVVVVAVVGLLVLLVRTIILDLFASAPGEMEVSVRAWLDGFDLAWLGWTSAVVLVVAAGLMALGIRVSAGILRRAGVEPAAAITWRACLLGTLLQAALSLLTGWLLGLLGLLGGVVGFGVLVLVYIVASTGASALIGYLAGPRLWIARARRMRRESAPAT